ncbi:phage tail protein [Leptolyngbya sp. AN02str]|uniref:phage tail protein n=1 Tax=Leptolyngbya sp. AN02str TaxID=3423363 RepID=UPI003D31C03A
MDANGLQFWMLMAQNDWARPWGVEYDPTRQTLRLASQRQPWQGELGSEPAETTVEHEFLQAIPQTLDAFGARAYWHPGSKRVVVQTADLQPIGIYLPPLGQVPTDLAQGYDGVLYVAVQGQVAMQDCRQRWPNVTVSLPNFQAWRLAADPAGGMWVLSEKTAQLARLQGYPLPLLSLPERSDQFITACEPNPNPPRLVLVPPAALAATEKAVAIAVSPNGQVGLLTWLQGQGRLWRFVPHVGEESGQGSWLPPITLGMARYPYSLAWLASDRIAVLLPHLTNEALVYALTNSPATPLNPLGEFYPLVDHAQQPFLHGVALPVHYPTTQGSQPLHPISLPNFAPQGQAVNASLFDSRDPQTVWHRLYLEAVIPPHCGIQVDLAASDSDQPPTDSADWYPHGFGQCPSLVGDAPRGVWMHLPSEVPFHKGVLPCMLQRDRAGLFMVLIQRANRRVRSLRGRYLHVRVQLFGDGRSTPEIAALRAYGPRFSYLNRYLPELYQETEFSTAANEPGRSTPPDFLERFLDNFESFLTPLEDRVAAAHLLTAPRTVPAESLDWLATWIGVSFDSAYPIERRRQCLRHIPELYRRRGTLKGLELALDLATGGIRGGEIVVIEDFRLRRTFATILGANLTDTTHPLLGGLAISRNSFVGDTLLLGGRSNDGRETQQEFLSLFHDELPEREAAAETVQAFFDALAYQATVFVHQDVEPQNLSLIRRIVDLETPAHVATRVVTASEPLMVGLAALVGVDTYLTPRILPKPVCLDKSYVSGRDRLLRPASLDPRLGGGTDPRQIDLKRPIAEAGALIKAKHNDDFQLDASQSQAFAGRTINRYIWTLLD